VTMDIFLPPRVPRPSSDALAFHQGVVVAWDALAGTNTVRVLGVEVDNLPSLIGSEVGLIRKDDVVGLLRFQNTFFVLGRIEGSGVAQRALNLHYAQTVTLNAPTASAVFQARNGPSVTVDIGSSRRCMVTLSAEISIANNVERMGVQISGASSIAAVEWKCLTISSAASEFQASRVLIFEAADGLNEGKNVFQTMHQTGNHTVSVPLVGEVQITVQPF
jgi:hypothetical protein